MTAFIKKRTNRSGSTSYLVYYRRGGRGWREIYAGAFPSKRLAETRRDIIAGELAAGRDPQDWLAALKKQPEQREGLAASWDAWMKSRKDVGESARNLYRNSRDKWVPLLGERTDPARITVDQIVAGLDEHLDELAVATVRIYLSHLAMTLDFADVHPNPARSPKIKLPAGGTAEKEIPSNEEWARILAHLPERSRLVLRLMECCGLRVSEACRIGAGDIDQTAGQILIVRSKTAAGKRWVPVPDELLEQLGGRLPSPSVVYYDLVAACEKAGTRIFSTHALRHRRISLWIRQGIDTVQVSRWAGHSKASMSSDTYGHTVVDAFEDEWLSFWLSRYTGARAKERTNQ